MYSESAQSWAHDLADLKCDRDSQRAHEIRECPKPVFLFEPDATGASYSPAHVRAQRMVSLGRGASLSPAVASDFRRSLHHT